MFQNITLISRGVKRPFDYFVDCGAGYDGVSYAMVTNVSAYRNIH
jgi:hypothetical protein